MRPTKVSRGLYKLAMVIRLTKVSGGLYSRRCCFGQDRPYHYQVGQPFCDKHR